MHTINSGPRSGGHWEEVKSLGSEVDDASMDHVLLIVDDEKDILDTLERQFRKDYKVFKASSGFEALKVLQKEKIHLILSDQRMPEMTGVQMFEKAQIVQPDAIRILLTGYTDVESVIAAINNGQIYRYITKPWDPVDLEIVIKRALESYDLRQELREKNRKLEQAYTELKTLDEAKSHFMILIGHELKTPLTTINSYLSLLKEEIQNADHKKYLSRAEQGTQRLNEIVFDVLDILAGETGQVKVKIQKIKTQDYLKNLISQYDALSAKKGLQVEYSVERDSLEGDENLLTKILKKIIHNAIKFSEENSHVRLGCSQAGELWVSNSGPTLTKDQIQRISQPFQIDENILHHSQGMGLGLTVCQSLLKAMGSELKIESQKNQTRVSFVVRQHPRS